jgi:class 3 adenylate cyclase/tetratricopeptide (TPR) repeat protein
LDDSLAPATFLGPYVPLHAQRRLAARAAAPDAAEDSTVDGAALVADVAGWTALTERLDSMHAAGADELSRVLRDVFGALDAVVTDAGGEIVHVAGDGLLAIWPVERALDLPAATRAAVACGLRIQSDVAGMELFEGHQLRLRVGVGTGSLWLPLVGGPDRWFAPVGGDPLRQIAAALNAARPGDVVASSEVVTVAGAGLAGSPIPQGMVKVDSIEAGAPVELPTIAPPEPDVLKRFVPDIVVARADAGMTGHFAELRRATTVFVKAQNADPAAAGRLERLQHVTSQFHEAARRFGGAVSVTLLDEDGLSMAATWGGAQHAHEDDAVRALRAAMRFAGAVNDSEVGVGVATGQTFIGDVGSAAVRRFTLLGKPANLAARLAGTNSGARVRCDADTMTAARHFIAFEELTALYVKGVQEATRLFRPVAQLDAARHHQAGMVGRAAERHALDELLNDLVAGRGGTVVVEGDAGIGKSTLVRELLNRSEAHPIRRLILRGVSLDQTTPYHPWRAVFQTLTGGLDSDTVVGRHLEPAMQHLAGLAAEVLPVSAPIPDQALSMQPEDRAALTRDLLSQLFSSLVAGAPLLMVLEDAHWYDTATWALVASALQRCPTVLTVLVSRGESPDPEPAEIRLRREATTLYLGPLTADETVALACNRLDVPSIPAEVADLLRHRSEGNPLFTEALLRSFQDAGVIAISGATREVNLDPEAFSATGLPSNVSAVLASRIDRLPLAHQTTIKAASVVGRYFTVADLEAIHPDAVSAATIKDQLELATAAGLVTANDAAPQGGYRFAHVLMVEAAHGLLPREARTAMHATLARHLAADHDADPGVLAHHWTEAGDAAAATAAFDRAGTAASAAGSDREVVTLLTQAEQMDSSENASPAKAQRLLTLGEARSRLGQLQAARSDLEAATVAAGMPMPRQRWRLAIGIVWQLLRQVMHRILPWLPRRRESGAARIAIGSKSYFAIVGVTYGLEDAPALAYAGLRATNEAERVAPSRTLAQGYSYLSFATGLQGWAKWSNSYHRRAIAAATAAQNPAAQADVSLFHAALQSTIGGWEAAVAATRDAERRYVELGNRRDHARTLAVRGFAFYRSGHYAESLAAYQALAALETEDGVNIVWERLGTGRLLLRAGQLTEAVGVLTSFARLADDVGETPTILARLGHLSTALWQEGRLDAAIETALEGLELMEQNESTVVVSATEGFAEVTRTLLEAAAQQSDAATADAARRATKSLGRVARRVPVAAPRATMSKAVLAARAGKRRRAHRGFRKALRQAKELGTPYATGLIELEMGRALGDGEALRRAEKQLASLGAVEDARLAKSAQAAM